MTQVRPEVLAYYARGAERARLSDHDRAGPLEYVRTTELLKRFLPAAPCSVLDVGGGPGAYSNWLGERGYVVHLIDPVPLHVEQASAAGISATVGDARALDHPDASVDVVLLMGPLYHLEDPADRAQALAEARRVLRPGGVLVATAISRYAALLDLLVRLDRLHLPDVASVVERVVATGTFHGTEAGMFTTAFFHLPSQLLAEVSAAGFDDVKVLNVEGPGFLIGNFDERWRDANRRDAILNAARLIETADEMLGAASHLMAVTRRTALA
jgi:SAM-dependent methyltransferase